LPGCGKPSPASVRSGEVVITHFRSRADQQPWLISLTRSLLDPLLSSPPLLHLFIHVCVCVFFFAGLQRQREVRLPQPRRPLPQVGNNKQYV
jgi:hypothetical protein